ncbi:ABC transporter ATP-binding protein [Chelativorans xinjiangense]|uniref:dipeptide ABC transporter ATP-binding protein n=1 Tax=Chelativorans xinjiangense TaxID=2681485 RepID=UPI00135CD51F|nr:ABC transporter ATP-binding protein [Chelativorans xinjiangense]
MTPTMTDVLDIRKLSVEYATARGAVHALRDVSLCVPRKKTVGIVGESGCGKSTLIASILHLMSRNARVPAGQILFNGIDTLTLGEDALRDLRGNKVSMVFQDPMTAQNPVIPIARQMVDIQYRERLSTEEKRKRAVAMLRRVGIPDPESRIDGYPHEFSGGMRQRISIAMALLVRPDLLIADEPTTALDVNMEAQIIFLLRELQQEFGTSLLFASHNLGLIAELCDDVVVMYAGEVVERGSVRDIFHEPQHPYTQRLLECDPALVKDGRRTLPTIPGRVPDLRVIPEACIFEARCHKAFSVCRERHPAPVEISDTQSVRCHLASGLTGAPVRRAEPRPQGGGLRRKHAGEPLLAVENLRVRYRTEGFLKALASGNRDPFLDGVKQVSLMLRRGETLGLVGESGSGKTSLGRAIIGLTPCHSGSIRFDGTELVGLPDAEYNLQRRKMAMMFQDPIASLSPRRTARSLVMEPFEIHGIKLEDEDAEAERLFAMVGLSTAFFNRYPHELSGGQARRVGAARALALSPELIIADEPTAGLDTSVQGEILNLMGELQREHGLSYLVISHNLPAIRHISDRIGVMYLGRLVEEGPVAEIFENPAHPYTRALIEGTPHPDPDRRRTLLSIEGEVPSLKDRPRGCEFHPRCPIAEPMCSREAPQARDIAPAHAAACHFPLNREHLKQRA